MSATHPTQALRSAGHVDAAVEWRARLAIAILAGTAFEALSGLVVYLAPFSVLAQHSVLLHTAIGVLWLPFFAWYVGRHWWLRYRGNFNHIQLLGYLGFGLTAACIVTGLVLTAQAVFGTRIGYSWDLVHLVTGVGLAFPLAAHLIVVWVRKVNAPEALFALRRAKRAFALGLAGGTVLLAALTFGFAALYREPPVRNDFPADYSWKFGQDRPFAPSLVRTASMWAYDPSTLSGSASCGTAGCHSDILREWEPTAHRYASSDLAFQAVQRLMLEESGAEATRYCAGCHDPIALFSGSKNVNVGGLTSIGAEEGVSCIVCHSIVQTDVRGNADYVIAQPVRYIGERKRGAANKAMSDFLIRAYPKQHKQSYDRPLYKTAEYCGACHKQFIDQEVNRFGWVQLQNQYDEWRKSRWYHEADARHTITCRECHMPLRDSADPAAGDAGDYNRSPRDRKHRSHRFLAANQVMPLLLDLPGAKEHVDLTEQWLRGEIEVPEIADKWSNGPVLKIELKGPDRVRPGERVDLQVIMTNNKTGHNFPTGPLDIIRSWVELKVVDGKGRLVYESGSADAQGQLADDSVVFKAEGIDRQGNLIDRHNLWEMVGARFKRALFAGTSDAATYSFICPELATAALHRGATESRQVSFEAPAATGPLTATARLNYQKAHAVFLDRLFGADAKLRTPITVMSSDNLSIAVDR